MRPLIALAAVVAVGCSRRDAPPPASPDATTKAAQAAPAPADAAAAAPRPIATAGRAPAGTPAPAPAELGPEGPTTVRSTHPDIFLRNLKARRAALDARLKARPDDHTVRPKLAAWHLDQMVLDGDLAHAVEAERLLNEALAAKPDDPKLLRQRAGVRAHVHRFAEARADLEKVLKANPDDAAAKRSLGWMLRNLGDWEAAEPLLAAGTAGTSFDDHGKRAMLHFLAGRVDEADLDLRRAHGAYTDVHPVPLAWIDLQRGHLRLRTGKWKEAQAFFKRAYDRLPQNYVVAEHLAEVEHLLGNHAESLRIYDEVVKGTGLPEFMAARAGVLRDLGRAAEADAEIAKADARWKALLAEHPSALAAHAVDFWLEDKPDPAEARKWAEKNLEVRQDPDSLLLAARARAATGDLEGARAALTKAQAYPIVMDEFLEGVAEVQKALGDDAAAAETMARARELNPRL